MLLVVNGEEREYPPGITVADLVAALQLKPEQIAVERNLEIVPRGAYGDCKLADGDRLEIVTLVGGGAR